MNMLYMDKGHIGIPLQPVSMECDTGFNEIRVTTSLRKSEQC